MATQHSMRRVSLRLSLVLGLAACVLPSCGSDYPPPDLRGGPYKPAKVKIPDDIISDWDSIDFPEMGTVRELRVYGFRELNSGKTLDLRSSDPIVFKTVEGCLRGGFPLRPAFSDIGVSTTADLGIDHLGILQITTREEKVIIGVSETKFYLGTWHGSNRQAFYSWGLAKQVDDLLFEATGKHLEKKHFEALSGEEIIRENKRLYEGIRAASRDQSSKGGAQPPEHAPED